MLTPKHIITSCFCELESSSYTIYLLQNPNYEDLDSKHKWAFLATQTQLYKGCNHNKTNPNDIDEDCKSDEETCKKRPLDEDFLENEDMHESKISWDKSDYESSFSSSCGGETDPALCFKICH